MIFADKLILLRKKAGWSQEELADQMNVTRQSVSKWEGAQSVPDLEKMLRLSELFGVSTDYLLKDEIEEAEHIDSSDDTPSLRRVSMEEANAFLSVKLRTAKTIAYAAFLCIVSPIALLILGAISESTVGVLNENIAGNVSRIPSQKTENKRKKQLVFLQNVHKKLYEMENVIPADGCRPGGRWIPADTAPGSER